MTPLDLAVVVGIAAVLALPYLRSTVGLLSWPAKKDGGMAWRQRWAATVIDFIEEVEAGEGTLERPEAALRLARELVWEIIGGDGPQPTKSK